MKIQRFRNWSIRSKLLTILAVSFLFLAVFQSVINIIYFVKDEERRQVDLLKERGDPIKARIEQAFTFWEGTAKKLAGLEEIKSFAQAVPMDDKRAKAEKTAEGFIKSLNDYVRGAAIVDDTGKVLLTTKSLDRLMGQTLPYVPQISADKPFSDLYFLKSDADFGSSAVLDEDDLEKKCEPTIAFVEPIRVGDETHGKVVLMAKAEGIIWKSLKSGSVKSITFALVDENGVVIGHTSPNSKLLFHSLGDLGPLGDEMIKNHRFGKSTKKLVKSQERWQADLFNARMTTEKFKIHKTNQKTNGDQSAGSAQKLDVVLDKSNKDDVSVGIPVYFDHKIPWTLYSFVSGEKFGENIKNEGWKEFFFNGLIMLLGILVSGVLFEILFTRQIRKPIKELAHSMGLFAKGDWHARVPSHGGDEIGLLGKGFNAMAAHLETTVKDLNAALAAQAASQARIRAIVETAGDGIVTATQAGVIESWNGAAAKMFGYEPREVLGKNIDLLLDSSCGRAASDIARQLTTGAILLGVPQEIDGKRKDGSCLPLEVAFSIVDLNHQQLYTAIMHDLTDRKRKEEQLREAKETAEKHDRAKSQFLANMSHELRTPLTVIIGYTEMLLEDAEDSAQPQGVNELKEMHGQAKHLLSLINDLLDMSKIEAGKVQLFAETFDLAKLVQDVSTTVKQLVAKNDNVMQVQLPENPGTMHTDETRLRQCLLNLLTNACKFTSKGTIALKITRAPTPEGEGITFEVRDSGIGMTDEQMKRIFSAFAQADSSTTRKFGGTGLGLTITKAFCQMMGGNINVQSEFGKGSTFTIWLPAHIDTQAKPGAPGTPATPALQKVPTPARGNTVLVVDDEITARNMISHHLSLEGFRVVTCDSGAEALRLAKELRPQAITLDVMMPGMDGWSVLSALKSDPETASIPVIILSIIDDKNLGQALGAADYLVKPLDREHLLSVLKKNCNLPSTGLALIAEDDPAMREMLRRSLEKANWTVFEAANGREALACVAEKRPALILLDLMMPEVDGFEFLDALRQNPEWRSIPVLIITAKELNEEERLFLNGSLLLSGSAKRVLRKGSFSRDELLREVCDLVAKGTGK